MGYRFLRIAFFLGFIRPIVWLLLGLNIRGRQKLPSEGPAIIAPNHNSHLDTVVMMSLFPIRRLKHVHPVAAADYWLANAWISWFAKHIIGVVPIERKPIDDTVDVLAPADEALDQGKILIYFPEGSRGEPEKIGRFKSGIARLSERHPDVPVIPVFLHGLGKAWPKGSSVIVPFLCDVFIGEPLYWPKSQQAFMKHYTMAIDRLSEFSDAPDWL